MGPGCNAHLSPGQKDIRMVSLLLGQLSDTVHESEGRLEIREFVVASDVMFVDHFPVRKLWELLMYCRKFFSLKGRNAAAAGNAGLVGKRRHSTTSSDTV